MVVEAIGVDVVVLDLENRAVEHLKLGQVVRILESGSLRTGRGVDVDLEPVLARPPKSEREGG